MNRTFRQLSTVFALLLLAAMAYFGTHRSGGSAVSRALSSAPEAGSVAAEEHFSPAENLEQIDLAHLRRAERTIDIAMYAFTDQYLAEALVERARAGVEIRVYRDREQFEQEQRHASERNRQSSTAIFAGERNIQIRVKKSHELMHLKAYLVDGRELRTGSANWSPSGLKRQDNNAHFTADPAQAKAFESAFTEMWERIDNQQVQ